MEAPTPQEVRCALAAFDAREQRIVAGLLALMIREPQRVREREWIAERLTEVTLLAGEFEADSPQAAVSAVQAFLQDRAGALLPATFLLFQRVGLDLAPRAAGGFSFEEALRCGLEYLPGPGEVAVGEERRAGRELGEQPLARLMGRLGLDPSDLVAASDEQLTFKMVKRAMKGRRLTARAMAKVQRAWNKAAGASQELNELFDYEA